MNREIILKKCNKCGAICKIIRDCSCSDREISCCGEGMNQVVLNSSEFAMEKHIPHVEIVGDNKAFAFFLPTKSSSLTLK